MQVDTNLIMIVLLCFLMIATMIIMAYANSKTNEKMDELEKKILKLETILEERKI